MSSWFASKRVKKLSTNNVGSQYVETLSALDDICHPPYFKVRPWSVNPWRKTRMGGFLLAFPLMLVGALNSRVYGQERPPSTPQLLGRSPHTAYVLGVGDQLNIRVVDLEEYNDRTVRVDFDGEVDLPLIGQVYASGDTLDAFKKRLEVKLSRYIDAPHLTVTVVTSHSSKVSVVGEVNSPGVRDLSGPTTLIEAISEAGGLKSDAGSRVVVTRSLDVGRLPIAGQTLDTSGTFATVSLPLDDLMLSKHPADNFLLRPGDIVSVARASIVYVVGDVHRSGGFPISSHSSMSVLRAISLAEGLQTNSASKSAKILRPVVGGDGKPTEIPVNVQAILAGKAPDPPLFAEDILFIPHNTAEAGAKRAAEIVLQVAAGVLIYR